LFLYENDKIVSDNDYDVFVLGKPDQAPGIISTKKVALYDIGEKILGPDSMTTARMLDAVNLKVDRISDFAALDNYQVLILGAFSFDPVVEASGAKIQGWLEKGGRLLCLEQMLSGPVPFLPQMQVVRNAPNILTELITIEHPVFKGLTPDNFDRWNGNLPEAPMCPGAVFVSAISPLKTVLTRTCASLRLAIVSPVVW